MAISITCPTCRKQYNLRDDMAGRTLKCAECNDIIVVPLSEVDSEQPTGQGSTSDRSEQPKGRLWDRVLAGEDFEQPQKQEVEVELDTSEGGVFDYDKYLMRQKLLTIVSQKYTVMNERSEPLIYVLRPPHLMQSCLAAFVLILFLAGGAGGMIFCFSQIGGPAGIAVGIALLLVGIAIAIFAFWKLVPRRHVTFYEDEAYEQPLMRVLQDQKFFLINAWFTLIDDQGEVLCRFKKNHLYNIFRKRWYIFDPDGNLLMTVKEDSLIISLLRRTIGAIFEGVVEMIFGAIFRTNFIFITPNDQVIGEFNRKFTITDRYVLDLTADRKRTLDRRIAVAMGVLLDTGESR